MQVCFNLRIEGTWQILLGVSIKYMETFKNIAKKRFPIIEYVKHKSIVLLLWVTIVTVVILPIKIYLPSILLRMFISFLCVGILYFTTLENSQTFNDDKSDTIIIDGMMVQFVGILNTIYAVHWPVLMLAKFCVNSNPLGKEKKRHHDSCAAALAPQNQLFL